MALNSYRLGELITQRREKKPENEELPIRGVSKDGFIPPKQIDADTDIYNVFYKKDFVYNPARMELGSIAFNSDLDKGICSSLYEMFFVHRTDICLPEYLALFVSQDEFARYCNFLSSGSAREYCRFANISQIKISLPSIEEQRKIVHDYKVVKDRIELLKKINENLEKQAYNIYDSEVKDSTIYCKIEDIGTFVRGKNITSEEMVAGEYDVISAGINPSGCHNEYNVKGPSITISGSGVNAGFFSIHSENIWAADCSYCNNTNYLFFLFCSLQRVKDKIEILKDGHSAQPHVYPKDVNIIEIPSLEASHINKLESILQKIYTAIFANCNEIRKLELLETSVVSKLSRNKEVA